MNNFHYTIKLEEIEIFKNEFTMNSCNTNSNPIAEKYFSKSAFCRYGKAGALSPLHCRKQCQVRKSLHLERTLKVRNKCWLETTF